MASQDPLIEDGAQTVAAADYSNTAASGGQGGSNQYYAVALSTSVARTSVKASSTGQRIYGVLQNKPKAGDPADVGIFGVTKAQVGSAGSTLGLPQMTDSTGQFTDWTAGSGYCQVGMALETGVSGQIISLYLWGAQAKVLT